MYPAIIKTNKIINTAPLLKEFNEHLNNLCEVTYEYNESWKSVLVYKRNVLNKLEGLPALQKIIDEIGIENIVEIGYFKLEPQATLHRHRDMNGNLLFGISRIHIPIQTNSLAKMEMKGRWYHLGLGEVWAIDTSGEHALKNESNENRIHIIIDVNKSKNTEHYFPPKTLFYFMHMFIFMCIVGFKIIRDIFSKPKSILNRIKTLKSFR